MRLRNLVKGILMCIILCIGLPACLLYDALEMFAWGAGLGKQIRRRLLRLAFACLIACCYHSLSIQYGFPSLFGWARAIVSVFRSTAEIEIEVCSCRQHEMLHVYMVICHSGYMLHHACLLLSDCVKMFAQWLLNICNVCPVVFSVFACSCLFVVFWLEKL